MKLDYYNPRRTKSERWEAIVRRLRLPALAAAFGLAGFGGGFFSQESMMMFLGEPLWRRGFHVYVVDPGESLAAAVRWALAVGLASAGAPLAAALWAPGRGRWFVARSLLFWGLTAVAFVPVALFVRRQFEADVMKMLQPNLIYEPLISVDAAPVMRAPLLAAAAVLLAAAARRVYSLTRPPTGSNIGRPLEKSPSP